MTETTTTATAIYYNADGTAELVELDSIDCVSAVIRSLTEDDLERYYEGFSNDTIWPLYHDVIVPATYHRQWWDAYVEVNRRFAEAAA